MNRAIRAYGEPGRRAGYKANANGRRRSWGLIVIVVASLTFWILLGVLLWRAI